jgi:hypothetical protein
MGRDASSFDLRLLDAKRQLTDAVMLPQRIKPLGPVPNQQPSQSPLSLTPQGLRVQGQMPMAGGMLSGQATVGPQGLAGAQGQFSAPIGPGQLNIGAQVGGGQFSVDAALDNALKLQMLQGRYQQGPVSVGAGYSPQGGTSANVQYRQQFQEGGLATSLRSNPADRQKDMEFINTRNQHMREVAGLPAYAKGGGVWTRKEGQNPEGGLNAKGRASLKAQGHDIKPPVSAEQAKKSPKAAARRKSFCARMDGLPGPMKDDKGRPTRKALSLNKWDC